MLVVTAALSVSEQIKSVGAYAGLASILGLAVLSLLYFGQARELKRLREWAGRAPERTAELQERADAAAVAAAQRRVNPPPVAPGRFPAPSPATAAGAAGRPVVAPQPARAVPVAGAPATATAPGAASPTASGVASPPPGATPTAPGATPTAPGAASTAAGAAPAGTPGAPPANGAPSAVSGGQATQSLPAVTPPPSGAAPPAPVPPSPRVLPPLPSAVPSIAASAPIGPARPPGGDGPVPLRQISPAGGVPRSRPGAEIRPPAGQEPSEGVSGRTIGVIAGSVVVVALVVVLATQLIGGGDPAPKAARTTSASTNSEFVAPSTGTTSATAPAVDPADYTVYVLNGTQQNGIAAEIGKTLEVEGFVIGGKGNAVVNTVSTTEVFFAAGKKKGASAVAKKLGVAAANVKPVDPGVSVQGSNADVIVQIGADKATG